MALEDLNFPDVYLPVVGNSLSHPTWDAGVIEDDGVMYQIYAFFPPKGNHQVLKNGLSDEEEAERQEKEEQYDEWPVKPGPGVEADRNESTFSNPYKMVWAACDYFPGDGIDWETEDPRTQEECPELTAAIETFIDQVRADPRYEEPNLVFLRAYGTRLYLNGGDDEEED